MVKKEGRLLEFYGTECKHCIEMDPIIKKVEKEIGEKLARVETWHNSENDQHREKVDAGFCGGVPFFYNERSGERLCGAVPFETLLKWAKKGAKKKAA